MKLFFQYIWTRRRGILFYLLFCIIFLGSFLLYHLPAAAVLYPAVLCAFFGLVIVSCNFRQRYKKHLILQEQLSSILTNSIQFPPSCSLLETDYQAIITALTGEKLRLEEEQNRVFTDLTDYYTMWAHQIKVPIASMRLRLSGEDSKLSRELSVDLQRIEQYVEMVLCYLRLDSDTTDYIIREYDLDSIINQAVKKFAYQFIAKKIRLVYEPLHCTVLTDEKWLLFVIEQVLSNALKYTRSGSVSITMESPKTLCIRDTGIGIATEDLPRIFEKGYTGYNGRVDKRASGIGLYLCRRICTNLGHQITAASSFDNGTTIRIDLNYKHLEVE